MSSSLSLLVVLSIQDEAMDVTRSVPQGAHYHEDVMYVLPSLGINKGARGLWYSELGLHQLGSRPTAFIPQWTTHPCILYQKRGCCPVRATGGSPLSGRYIRALLTPNKAYSHAVLLRYSTKSPIAQEECLVTSHYLVTRLHLP